MGQYQGRKSLSLKEALGDLDDNAKIELDGVEPEDNTKEADILDVEDVPEPPDTIPVQREYSLQNVIDQLGGMVDKWFKLAAEMPPDKKENFLKLGDRLDEVIKVLQSEFM